MLRKEGASPMPLWIVGEVTPSHMGKPRSQIFSCPDCPLRQPLIFFFDAYATPIYRGFDEWGMPVKIALIRLHRLARH